ncbi:hypothetical protein Adt_42902 [Abeliophyllum distichum]|uniref:Uncharacterized protein n=1 Tax=Abeliophyllum distichum TaxID=126358 RepID=A0ABD1PWZ5_9LAMI
MGSVRLRLSSSTAIGDSGLFARWNGWGVLFAPQGWRSFERPKAEELCATGGSCSVDRRCGSLQRRLETRGEWREEDNGVEAKVKQVDGDGGSPVQLTAQNLGIVDFNCGERE